MLFCLLDVPDDKGDVGHVKLPSFLNVLNVKPGYHFTDVVKSS